MARRPTGGTEVFVAVLYSIIKPNNYQDSLRLMRLSNTLATADGVDRVSVMMGTQMNKDILRDAGLVTGDLDGATAADLMIFADVTNEDAGRALVAAVDLFLSQQAQRSATTKMPVVRSLEHALTVLGDANLAIVSVPGEYAAAEARRLLDRGINVFLFSDNVSVEDEIALKEQARDQGLLVMGPDCGTGASVAYRWDSPTLSPTETSDWSAPRAPGSRKSWSRSTGCAAACRTRSDSAGGTLAHPSAGLRAPRHCVHWMQTLAPTPSC